MHPGGASPVSAGEDGVTLALPPRAARARRCPTCQQPFSGEARFCPFDGDLLAEDPEYSPTRDPLLGTIVDQRYEVLSVLGEGGMGTVYEVKHKSLGRRFALKVLRRDIADAEHIERFIQEAKAAAAIGHPNIVAVSDFGELTIDRTKMPYFVMEMLEGQTLARLLKDEKRLEPTRAATLLLQCASALAAAHAAGVIHRDLKPDNIFITRAGDREFVKILDFGVAKMAGAGRLTRAGMVFGTPHYMSPEQAAGQGVDLRTDIYALGVILYECFAGRVPFEADTYMGVLTKHMFATPEPIERSVRGSSKLGLLAPIAMRCLGKKAEDRYSDMAAVASALEKALADLGALHPANMSSRRPPPPATSSVRPAAKGAAAWKPLAVGAGILVVGVAVFFGVRSTSQRSTPAKGEEPPAASASGVATPPSADSASRMSAALSGSASAPPPLASADPSGRAPTLRAPKPTATSADPPKVPGKRPGGDVVDPWGH